MKDCTTFYFFSLGIWTTIPPMVITWIAVEDLLCGVLWSSTVVLISYSIPEILSKFLSPLMVKRISFTTSFVLLTALLSGSVALIVSVDDVQVRIIGVGFLGIANGFTIITCVRLLAYYEKAERLASAYQNGNNFSTFLASVGYTGLTTWLGVTPRIAVASCIPICFFPLLIYILLDKNPLKDHLERNNTVQYEALPVDLDVEQPTATPASFLRQTLEFLVKVFPYFLYTYLSNFSLQLSMVAVLTTLTFSASPFPPRDHFLYYRLLSDAGIWLSGASVLVSFLSPERIDTIRIKRIWFLVLLNVSHLLFFFLASWYRFLSNFTFVLVLCFTQGVLQGLALIYSMMDAASLFPCPKDNGTAMGLLEIGLSVGRIAAALSGISVEKQLREHCTYTLLLGRFCLARHKLCG